MVARSDVGAAFADAGYQIEAVIGRGGVGTVYRAVQLSLRRDVALKLLTPSGQTEPAFRERFLEESILTASLEHPNIVPVYDAGEVDGTLYLAMRYIPGSDLQGMIRREGRLSPHASIGILEQVAAGLQVAHDAGLVHRDVKPSNVLIAGDHGPEQPLHAWLGDFGLSRRMADPEEASTERPLGTVHYVAPEQIRGEPADARCDVYSLGCLLYECLTGTVPFAAHSSVAAVLFAHLNSDPPRVTELGLGLPATLDDVLGWALAKDPAQRPESAAQLARVAAVALAGEVSRTEPRTVALAGEVSRTGARTGASPRLGASTPRRRRASRPIVGRLVESEDLVSLLDDAVAGAGGVAMLSGDPGIGKTTLARELSTLAEHRGIPAVWGVGSTAEAARPYWHWIQVIRAVAGRREGRGVVDGLGAAAGWLRTIVPDLDLEVSAAPSTGSDEGRFHVYDALRQLLESAAERSGLLIVLDDLHLADEASLRALSYISRSVAGQRILIVGTQRDLDLEHSRRGAVPFSELVRPTLGIAVKGLAAADVRLMIEARRGSPPPEELVARIHGLTAGNPLFVSELLSLIEAERITDASITRQGALPLPTGVRDAIAARLSLLSPPARELLGVASVIGQRFSTGVLAIASDTPAVEVLERLDEAVRIRLIRPVTDSPDAYTFDHGLVQATLYDLIGRPERMALHHAIALALGSGEDVTAGEALTEIARHHLAAAPAHDPGAAVTYAWRAGDWAMSRFAYDQAVMMYQRALAVDAVGETERGALLQALGEAQMRAGDTSGARQTLIETADAARARDDAVAFAHAVLGCGIWGLTNGIDVEIIGLAEEAATRLSAVDEPGQLARVNSFLAAAIYWSNEVQRRERLADDALSTARAQHAHRADSDSAATLGYVLGRFLLARWGPLSAQRDLHHSDEAIKLARTLADGELELLVRNWRITELLGLGRFAAVDSEIARVEQMAGELRQPRAMVFLPLHHAIRAATAGRFGEAEELNARSAEIGREVPGSVSELAGSAQLLMIRLLQGRLPELEQPLRAMTASRPELVGYRCALAAMLIQAGRPAEARDELERLTEDGSDGLPKDCTYLLMLALTGDVAAELGDAERSHRLYGRLADYSGRWVVSAGAFALWPVDRSLGRLAITMGSPEIALQHIAQARAQSERVGAAPSVALVTLDEARARRARGRPEDLARARELAGEALGRAQTLGMGVVVDAAISLDVELELGVEADA